MVLENQPNRFAADRFYESEAHRMLGQQLGRPLRPADRRVAARQRHDPRFLPRLKQPGGACGFVPVERCLQSLL